MTTRPSGGVPQQSSTAAAARTTQQRRRGLVAAAFTVVALLLSYLPAASPAAAHTVSLTGANAVYNGTWPPNAESGWNLPALNPALNPACGIDVGILIDRSGSIADAGQQANMRESAKDIVEALAGTPSKVGVWSFGTSSSAMGTVDHPARQLTAVGGPTGAAGVISLSATIDSIPIVSGVATNWEAGFNSVDVASDAGTDPNLLFVLTDGNPTVHIDDLATGGTTNNDDVDGGIRTANLVKANGTRVFGVGIGAGITASTLGLIANPLAHRGSNFETAGYALTSFSNLSATVRGLATQLCGGSVTVQKQADPGTGVFSRAPGWSFTLDPTNARIPNQTEFTDAGGQANFDLDSFATEQVTLTENLAAQPGYVFLADQLVCTNSNGAAPTLTPVATGATFDLSPTDIIECTFKNKKEFVDLSIVKSDGGVSTVPGGQVTYTPTYGNAGNVAAPNTVITETVPARTTVDLGVGPADGKNDGWVCNGLQAGVFLVGVTCMRAVGTVAAGASGLTVSFTVTVVNPAPFGLSLITNTATIDYDGTKGPDTKPADNTSTDTTPVVTDPQLSIDKKVVRAAQDCAIALDELTIVAGQSVKYCYAVNNPGNAPMLNVLVRDDNATPGVPGDDFTVTLSGLTNRDRDGLADDLAAGATATGASSVVSFEPGTVINVATATGSSSTGESFTDDDTAVVTITDVPPTIVVTKDDGGASVAAPGGPVEFTVEVTNTSFESVTVTSITDSVDGGAAFGGTAPAVAPVLATTCQIGVVIAAGGSYTCAFWVNVSGDVGDIVEDTVIAMVVDNDGTPTAGTDDETTPVVAVPEVLGAVVTSPATPAVVVTSALPSTGSDTIRLVLFGLALLGAGALLVAGARRRRSLGE